MMAVLAAASLLVVLDSLAKGVALFEAGVGLTTSVASTVAKGAANNVTTLVDVGDADLAALITEFDRRTALVIASALYRTLNGERLLAALDVHYGGTGSLNRYLTTQDKRVHPDLRKIGMQIDGINAFAPALVSLATFTVTGDGAGTYVDVASVDGNLYGKANCVLRATTLIGVATIEATLTMDLIDGTTESKAVSIPNGTASGTEFDIGTHDTDMYVGCSAISITGGTADDAFEIRTKVERTLVL